MNQYRCPISGCDLRRAEIPQENRANFNPGVTHYSALRKVEIDRTLPVVVYNCPICRFWWHTYEKDSLEEQRVRFWKYIGNQGLALDVIDLGEELKKLLTRIRDQLWLIIYKRTAEGEFVPVPASPNGVPAPGPAGDS